MSKHKKLLLHRTEENLNIDLNEVLNESRFTSSDNPITGYFKTTNTLVQDIINQNANNSSKIFGFLILGVISAAEFYIRRVLSELVNICQYCKINSEKLNIPIGANSFYLNTTYSILLASMEHKSLADAKEITSEFNKITGLEINKNSSAMGALNEFEKLCEIRHCLIHSNGYIGFKTSRALNSKRSLHEVTLNQELTLNCVKISHNMVRAVNNLLITSIFNRWIDSNLLAGDWKEDKKIFTNFFKFFYIADENQYQNNPRQAYATIKTSIVARGTSSQ